MIGTGVQPRRPRITSTPSMPGQAEVEDRRGRGACAPRASSAASPVGGEVDVVAARAQVRAERAQDLRLVVDDEDAASFGSPAGAATMVSPPPGVSSTSISPPIASTKPFATARPSPTPSRPARVAEPLERQEEPLALRRRDAGAAVDDAHVDAAVDGAGRDHASRRPRARSGSRWRSRWRAPARAGPGRRARAAASRARRARRPPSATPRLRSAAGSTSSSPTGCRH